MTALKAGRQAGWLAGWVEKVVGGDGGRRRQGGKGLHGREGGAKGQDSRVEARAGGGSKGRWWKQG